MGRVYFAAFTLLSAFQVVCVTSIELLANYKFWDSVSNQIIYDYSGNSRHGEMLDFENIISTDRGVTNVDGFTPALSGMSLVSTSVQGYSDFALIIWALRISDHSVLYNFISDGDSNNHFIGYDFSSTSTALIYRHISSLDHGAISGWNLFTIRLYPDRSN
jgi:hypothetical protein